MVPLLENPLLGGVARSAGVGSRINNPYQVVGYGPKTLLKSPLVQGGAVFIERGAALRGMKNALESRTRKWEPLSPAAISRPFG